MKSYKVALIGLDGSGKSANIDIMKNDSSYSDYVFTWVRWKPTLLKPLYALLNSKINNSNKKTADIVEGIEAEKTAKEQVRLRSEYNSKAGIKKKIFRSPLVRMMWIGIATFDYFLQFYMKTFGNLSKKRKMIFDRFYLDLYVDQGINFGYTPKQIEKEIDKHQWLFPRMEKTIYIRVTPEVCYRRKDDIPNMEYLKKRFDIYEYLAARKGWTIVNGELPLEEVNRSIKLHILGEV